MANVDDGGQLEVPTRMTDTEASEQAINNGVTNSDPVISSKPKSFSEAVASASGKIDDKARFIVNPGNNEAAFQGKSPLASAGPFSLTSNSKMLAEIVKEKNKLKDTAIFFASVEIDKCPPRKFLDDWFHNFWNMKLGFNISFCRQIQKGLFVIFFPNHEAQQEVLKRQYWTVGSTSFRVLAWTPEAVHEEVLALSAPRWILVKNIPPFLWRFLPLLMENFGKTIRMDETSRLVPHMDARVLISIFSGKEIPNEIEIKVLHENFVCPIEILGGLNACFLCRREGHRRKDCPIINKSQSKPSSCPKSPFMSNNPVNHSVVQPSTDSHDNNLRDNAVISQVDPPPIIHRNPHIEVVSGLDNDEGFTLVSNKKKRKKNNSGQPKSNSLKKIHPPSQAALPPPSIVLSQGPVLDARTIRSDLTPAKFPPKVFKEIDDGYIFEIIPAKESKLNETNMDLEPSEWVDSSKMESMNMKRRGRPLGSRNKSTGKLDVDSFSSPITVTEIACQDTVNVSQ